MTPAAFDPKIDDAARRRFDEDGYHMIPGLLSEDEARAWRLEINRVFGLPEHELTNADIGPETRALADGVTKTPQFWPLIFNERLVATVRALLGDDVRYTQHSDIHINLGAGKFHRDSAWRDFGVGPDWDEHEAPYRVVRVAIYLSDYTNSGSSLLILPGTHRHESRLNRLEFRFWNELRTRWRNHFSTNSMPQWALTAPRKLIRHKPGDCVVFDQRLVHAGGAVRGTHPKYAVYLSYGRDNQHAHNHHDYYLERPTYLRELPDALAGRLEDENLLLSTRTRDTGRSAAN